MIRVIYKETKQGISRNQNIIINFKKRLICKCGSKAGFDRILIVSR